MFTFRSIELKDEKELFHLACEFPTPTPLSYSAFSAIFTQRLLDDNACTLVAEQNGILIGYLSGQIHSAFYASGKVGWVDEIFVVTSHRKSGIGKQLMSNFELWAKSQSCVLVSLATVGATHFYEAQGYVSKAGYYKKYM